MPAERVGDWIPVAKALPRKRETLAIAAATGRSRQEVVGWLVEFWCWVDGETADGVIPGLGLADVVQAVGADEAFWRAVEAAGWLTVSGMGRALGIPNFGRWLGRSAKRRVQDTDRKRNVRSLSASRADKSGTREEDSREEIKGEASASPLPAKPAGQAGTARIPSACTAETAPTPPAGRSPTPPDCASGTARTTPKPRPRDGLFDAVAELTASDPKASGTHVGRVCKALRSADPPYTADEVRALPEALAAAGLEVPLTLGVVEKYIRWVRDPPRRTARNGVSARDRLFADARAKERQS